MLKIRLVEAELFLAYRRMDGQTQVTKLLVSFRNFSNPYNSLIHSI